MLAKNFKRMLRGCCVLQLLEDGVIFNWFSFAFSV